MAARDSELPFEIVFRVGACAHAGTNIECKVNFREVIRSPIPDENLRDALCALDGALDSASDDGALWAARGRILLKWSRLHEAQEAFRRAGVHVSRDGAAAVDAAWCAYLLGDRNSAERLAAQSVRLDHHSAFAHFVLGVVRMANGSFASAVSALVRARELDPQLADCLTNIGVCRQALGDLDGAEADLRAAVAQRNSDAQAWTSLGLILASRGYEHESLDAFAIGEAVGSGGDEIGNALTSHVATLLNLGQTQDAVELCEQMLPDVPDPRAHGLYALALLRLGEYARGWQQYEFRWCSEPMLSLRAGYAIPVWSGQDLLGKTILLRSEQGFGDIIQFARYASVLKGLGATVLLQVHAGMERLAQGFAGVDRAFVGGETFTAFDYYLNLMSAPTALGTTLANVPTPIPYLVPEEASVALWKSRLGACRGLRVGIVWAGNPGHVRDRYRSAPLALLRPLFALDGVQFVSLQKSLRHEDEPSMPGADRMRQLGSDLADFADAAAVIAQLDLVISVDTAVAHLAGAMGKPVWLLLPKVGDFRWLESRTDSPWYPTMRLFRQRVQGEWSAVIEEVVARLQELRGARQSAAISGPASDLGIATTREGGRPAGSTSRPVAQAVETRHGIVQYWPELDDEARSLARYGEYLQQDLDLLAHVLPMDAQVLELGSGVGMQLLWLARSLGDGGHVFAYEDRPEVRRLLQQNVTANGLRMKVTLPKGRLGQRVEEDGLADTVDDLRLSRIDLLKVRAGHRLTEIIAGATRALGAHRPVIFASVIDVATADQSARELRPFGYRAWLVNHPLFASDNFNRRTDDIFDGRRSPSVLALPMERCTLAFNSGLLEIGIPEGRIRARRSDLVWNPLKATWERPGWIRRRVGALARWLGQGTEEKDALPPSSHDQQACRDPAISDMQVGPGEVLAREAHGVSARLPAAHVGEHAGYERARTLFESGRFREARDELLRSGAGIAPDTMGLMMEGIAELHIGHAEAAIVTLRRAVEADHRNFEAAFGLAQALAAARIVSEADVWFAKAIELCPQSVEYVVRRAALQLDIGQFATAQSLARQALELNPEHAGAWGMLGMALLRRQDLHGALTAFERAYLIEEASGADGNAFVNYAITLSECGRTAEALSIFVSALTSRPDPFGHMAYGVALLRSGEFRTGWQQYEFRWMTDRFLPERPGFAFPAWTGQDLAGKRIVLLAEQGLGDSIQFVRFAPLVKARGAEVWLLVPPTLGSLLRSAPGVDHVPLPGDPIPEADFFVHLMSLPKVLGTTLASIPCGIPYLAVDHDRRARWDQTIGADATATVGIVWAGNVRHQRDAHRSMPLMALAPLVSVSGVRFYSLQKELANPEDAALLEQWGVTDLRQMLVDFSETAACLCSLDLLITVDTSVAHLAGALGTRVWLLLPLHADFRWLEGTSDSPWYPSLRIFRQTVAGRWDDVVDRVYEALRSRSAGDTASSNTTRATIPLVRASTYEAVGPSALATRICDIANCRYGTLQIIPARHDEFASLQSYGDLRECEVQITSELVRRGDTILEIAAGVGAHSIPLARALGPSGHLIIDEGRELERRVLRQNLRTNGVTNHTLLNSDETTGVVAIDSLQLRELSLLKVTDGIATTAALAGAEETLWRLRPRIVVSVARATDVMAVVRLLQGFGYRCWSCHAPLYEPSNFARRSEDMFAGRRSYAVIAAPEESSVVIDHPACEALT